MAALRREAAGHRIQLEAELADVQRRLQGIISAIEKGAYNATVQARLNEATVQARLNELEARQAELVAQLDAFEASAPVRAAASECRGRIPRQGGRSGERAKQPGDPDRPRLATHYGL